MRACSPRTAPGAWPSTARAGSWRRPPGGPRGCPRARPGPQLGLVIAPDPPLEPPHQSPQQPPAAAPHQPPTQPPHQSPQQPPHQPQHQSQHQPRARPQQRWKPRGDARTSIGTRHHCMPVPRDTTINTAIATRHCWAPVGGRPLQLNGTTTTNRLGTTHNTIQTGVRLAPAPVWPTPAAG